MEEAVFLELHRPAGRTCCEFNRSEWSGFTSATLDALFLGDQSRGVCKH